MFEDFSGEKELIFIPNEMSKEELKEYAIDSLMEQFGWPKKNKQDQDNAN